MHLPSTGTEGYLPTFIGIIGGALRILNAPPPQFEALGSAMAIAFLLAVCSFIGNKITQWIWLLIRDFIKKHKK